MCGKKDLTGALILIALGLVFLFNNFGLLPWSIWKMIWKLWPLLLIVPGIMMLIRNK